MATQAAFGGSTFSSHVLLWIERGEHRVPLSQVGADFIMAAEPCDVEAGPVTVVVSINGREHRHQYMLDHDLSEECLFSTISTSDAEHLPF